MRPTSGNDDRLEHLTLTTTIPLKDKDGLQGAIQRIQARLLAQAEDDLRQGRTVEGQFWEWLRTDLSFFQGKETLACRVDEVTAVDVLEGQICVWRAGQDELFARIPADSRNAQLLGVMLGNELAKRPAVTARPPEQGLGRILFERNSKKYFVGAVVIAALIAGAGVVFMILPLIEKSFGQGMVLVGLGCLAGSGLVALMAASHRVSNFRCHECGVFQRNLFRERELRYENVVAFTYGAVRQFVNGAYTGTQLTMKFEPDSASNAINYNTSVKGPDQALDDLRDFVAKVIAGRMARKQGAGEIVPWTPQMSFAADGLHYKPAGWFGSNPEQFVPYGQIDNFAMQHGYFYLYAHGEKKPIMQVIVSEKNFFPGFFLFLSLFKGGQQQGPA